MNSSMPQRSFEKGMNEAPASYGTATLTAGLPEIDVFCGDLTKDSMINVYQNAASVGFAARLIERKYNGGGAYQRTDGTQGAFVVGTSDGSNATNDVTFDWIVLPRGAI